MSPTRVIRRAALVISTLVAVGTVVLGALPAAAERPPGLSITIDNGASKTAPNTEVSYETTLTNAGTDAVTATIVVTVPLFATIKDAPDGAVDGVNATWSITVDPGSAKTVTATAHIGSIPDEEYRVTTLASVYLGETTDGPPVIRSADSDKIPGVVDPIVGAPTSGEEPQEAFDTGWVAPVIVVGAVFVLAVLVLLFLRSRLLKSSRRPGRR